MVRLCHIDLLLELDEIGLELFGNHRVERVHSQQVGNLDALDEGGDSLALELLLLLQAGEGSVGMGLAYLHLQIL